MRIFCFQNKKVITESRIGSVTSEVSLDNFLIYEIVQEA